ncbi:uncharacterized protein LOC142983963 [Anticarsia gemmatalis]|uniref:uncharacterized protein LOC142983963 n=1 Tax=Anticarsia gemmatalis TaxID=129554 RepID=UPI003F76E57F
MLPKAVCFLVLLAVTGIFGRYLYEPSIRGTVETSKIVSTYENALAKCRSDGAVFAAPVDQQLRDEIVSLISVNNNSLLYFINAKLVPNIHSDKPQFVSSEGVSLDDMSVSGMFEKLDTHDGECLATDGRTIRVVSCSEPLRFMCYRDDTVTSTTEFYESTTELEILYCGTDDEDYKLVPSMRSCYKYHSDRRGWNNAKKKCEDEGGYLLILNNEAELQAIVALKYPPYWDYGIFIGIRDFTGNNNWTSVHGDKLEDIYHKWHSGHNIYSEFYCGTLNGAWELDHYYCNLPRPFICEKDALVD